jgi:C-terminal processing protease CtpA/Prc
VQRSRRDIGVTVNTKIKLEILRKGVDQPLDVAITRETIRVRAVRSHNEGDDVGYVRITQFTEQAADGLKKAINDINNQLGADKVKGYVIDLRNNPGGLLDQAISVSDTFLERGEIGVGPHPRHQDQSGIPAEPEIGDPAELRAHFAGPKAIRLRCIRALSD